MPRAEYSMSHSDPLNTQRKSISREVATQQACKIIILKLRLAAGFVLGAVSIYGMGWLAGRERLFTSRTSISSMASIARNAFTTRGSK